MIILQLGIVTQVCLDAADKLDIRAVGGQMKGGGKEY
jgi:hypothetical protein